MHIWLAAFASHFIHTEETTIYSCVQKFGTKLKFRVKLPVQFPHVRIMYFISNNVLQILSLKYHK